MTESQEPREWETKIGPFVASRSYEVTPAMRNARTRRNAWIWVAVAVFLLLTGNWLLAIPAGIWAALSLASAMTQTPTKEIDR